MIKNSKKQVIIICLIILILVVILIILSSTIKKQKQSNEIKEKVNLYTSVNDFKTVEEVATYLECEFIKQENSKTDNYNFDIYMKIKYEPYTNGKSNENFYNMLISYCAKVLDYKSFIIIDKENNITIQIICDNENKKIKNKIINGEENYFSNHNSHIQISKIENEKETNFKIQSNIINNLIQNNWKTSKEFGTRETIFNNYDIYFDEGIEVRSISNNIFNIVFTKKYSENIVNNIKTLSSKSEIINALGEPSFVDEQYGIIGYKGKEIYLFYNQNQEISIYKVEKEESFSDFSKFVDLYLENKDEDELIQNIKNKYTNFDKYENNSKGLNLTYTLQGIEIKFQKISDRGIQIYKNYKGNIYKDVNIEKLKQGAEIPNNIFINNENLVFKNEKERLIQINNLIENAKIEKQNNTNNSNKYYTVKTTNPDGSYKIEFISIDKENANSELKENVNYYLWIDDDNLIYSIKNKGIYLFNIKQKKYGTIITGKDEFKLIEYKDNLLKYDDKNIKIKL